jgi:hypothetical protein
MSATRAPPLAQGARIALVPTVGADAGGGAHVGAFCSAGAGASTAGTWRVRPSSAW